MPLVKVTRSQLAALQGRPVTSRKTDMNKDEAAYAERLRADPEVLELHFNAVKFRLADGAWYTPDFCVVFEHGAVHCVEVKGQRREAGILRFKLAREKYPGINWRMVRRVRGRFEEVAI